MELPIFNDNLKSSGSWAAQLERTRQTWARMESGGAIRERQIAEGVARAEQGIEAARLREAAELVARWASEPEAGFTFDRLLALHRTLIGAEAEADVLRKADAPPINAMHDPAPALIVPRMLDNAFDWFSTDSFRELHPVEQASVVYLRLLDLHPFPAHTEMTALLAAGFYTERAALPPLIVFADDATRTRYRQALDAAFRMLTQPLVEFFADMLRRAMTIRCGGAA
jgi:hypothetical protein